MRHPTRRRHVVTAAAAVVAIGFFASAPANAHFVLQSPQNWLEQDLDGVPIKLGPCGDEQDEGEGGGAVPTGTVTAFQSGTQVTVTIDEVIFHPGHYRIALAVHDRSELPPEPIVDAAADPPCGTAAIEDPPVFPVLADNVFPHVMAFSTPQTTQVTLPANVTCDHCTLQVIEFMSDHPLNVPGGCFYHHCADISIQSTPVVDAGSTDGGEFQLDDGSGGCGCSIPTRKKSPAVATGASLFLLMLLSRTLRRKNEGKSGH